MVVYYRDIVKTYGITPGQNLVEIPWATFFSENQWTSSMDGEAMALLSVRYKDPQGIEQVAKFRGLAKIVVTKPGYDRLPIDSGFSAWKTDCKIEYSTAGRGAIQCK
jgi:hypothetical protein